jgi:hypothetical protein
MKHAILAVLLAGLMAGCSHPKARDGWTGDLVDPDGNPITPPTYEVTQ